jgi:monoterpene epsilon-lactone hydrolase
MSRRHAATARPFRPTPLSLPAPVMRPWVRQLGRRVLDPALPWEVQRRRLDRLTRASPLPKGTTVVTKTINGVRAEVIEGGRTSAERTVVHFHGGGYCVGSAGTARAWAAHLSARAACRVVLPEYRLAPEHAHPAAVDDARDVLTALVAESGPRTIVVSGDSAGGGLALSALLEFRDNGEELPAGCILISPWLDLGRNRRELPELMRRDAMLTPRWLEACAAAYAEPSNWASASVSPLLADHRGLPPLLVQAGSDDLLAPDAEGIATRASAAGVDVTYTRWPRMWHDFALQPGLLAAAGSALLQATWFVNSVTGAADAGSKR